MLVRERDAATQQFIYFIYYLEIMSPETISAIVGFALPPFIDVVNTKITNSKVRFVVSLVVSLLIGLVTVFFTEGLDFSNPSNILLGAAAAFTTAQVTYKQYYENSKARTAVKAQVNKIVK